ncbi:hypothetical protein BEL04_04815 [Mucilaginibacter sp. PPCGB 2223]|uniref:NAD(P)-dependent oxidoreductase n=1 Tax=Mucilaginibacter sp. PPCGB 2223 TaxID=1886027 RepID=UPI0008249219|nr:NAD(P)H-binding protein [Mucilaginibacter sp. PPCGB 2223]OCX53619.1 hypothetical protein BEL04_04815 [Mucilaginibacter sp. PPCGB 2223]
MNQHKTIAVIGGTGKAGKYLVQQLLKNGYTVNALVRTPENFAPSHPALSIVKGDIQNIAAIQKILKGCNAVLSTLGQTQGEPLISALAATNILAVMKEYGIKRYIFVCGMNIDVPGDNKNAANIAKSDWMRNNFPAVVADKQRAYEIVAASVVDWTMVRVPMIVQSDEKNGVTNSLQDCPGESINTSDLADFLISQIDDKRYIRKSPFAAGA